MKCIGLLDLGENILSRDEAENAVNCLAIVSDDLRRQEIEFKLVRKLKIRNKERALKYTIIDECVSVILANVSSSRGSSHKIDNLKRGEHSWKMATLALKMFEQANYEKLNFSDFKLVLLVDRLGADIMAPLLQYRYSKYYERYTFDSFVANPEIFKSTLDTICDFYPDVPNQKIVQHVLRFMDKIPDKKGRYWYDPVVRCECLRLADVDLFMLSDHLLRGKDRVSAYEFYEVVKGINTIKQKYKANWKDYFDSEKAISSLSIKNLIRAFSLGISKDLPNLGIEENLFRELILWRKFGLSVDQYIKEGYGWDRLEVIRGLLQKGIDPKYYGFEPGMAVDEMGFVIELSETWDSSDKRPRRKQKSTPFNRRKEWYSGTNKPGK